VASLTGAEVRLRVMSPGYTGFSAQYVDALLQLRRLCAERQIRFFWSGIQHLADIVSVRNEIARIFMEGDFTHLLMIDGDIGYEASCVLKMIDRDVDFAVASPPARSLRIDHVARAAAAGDKAAERLVGRYYVTPLAEDTAAGRMKLDERGFMRIESIGGAFLLLRRSVFERLAQAHPELQYASVEGSPAVSYFEGGLVDGVRLGEDRMFCRRWRQLGGDIHLLADASMTHTGPFTFSGNFGRFAGLVEPTQT
jgi:hypothetical protein